MSRPRDMGHTRWYYGCNSEETMRHYYSFRFFSTYKTEDPGFLLFLYVLSGEKSKSWVVGGVACLAKT